MRVVGSAVVCWRSCASGVRAKLICSRAHERWPAAIISLVLSDQMHSRAFTGNSAIRTDPRLWLRGIRRHAATCLHRQAIYHIHNGRQRIEFLADLFPVNPHHVEGPRHTKLRTAYPSVSSSLESPRALCQTSSSTRGAGARLSNHRGMTSTLAYVYMRNGTTLRNVAAAPCNVHALVKGTAEASHHAL